MTRKKVKLAFITNDSSRKATFKKRKKGLMKKVSELSTLCGVEACAIIYSPYDSQPQIWPSPLGVQRVLSQFKKMPEMEQTKKMVNQESFLRQRIAKANEQLKKYRKDNREKEITRLMFQSLIGKGLHGLNVMDLNDLGWLVDQNLKDISKRIESFKKVILTNQNQNQPQTLPQVHVEVDHGFKNGEDNMEIMEQKMEIMQRQQPPWFMDLVSPVQDHMGFVVDDMLLPFADHNHTTMWSNAFFP